MKNLAERLEDYKLMKRTILKGETENGYELEYGMYKVSFSYRELDNHLVVEGRVNSHKKATAILEMDEEEKVKQVCYNQMMAYLRRNTHVAYGKIWAVHQHPCQTEDGSLTVISTLLSDRFLPKRTKLWSLPEETRERINRKRERKGFAPVN